MDRIAASIVLVLGLTSQGAVRPRESVDAFLAVHAQRPLVDPSALSPEASERLVRGRVSSTEPRYGVPTFFWAAKPEGQAVHPKGLTAEQAARRHLADHAEIYRASPARWAEATRARVHDTGDGAIIVAFQQDVDGLRIFRDEVKVVMDRDLRLVAIAGYLTPEVRRRGGFDRDERRSLAAAFQHLTGQPLDLARLSAQRDDAAGYHRYALTGERRPARARPVWFPMPDGLEPSHYVELEVARSGAPRSSWFSYVVSARTGAVLYRKNLTVADAYSYRVWADPSGVHVPDSGPQGHAGSPHPGTAGWAPPFVAPILVTQQSGPISTQDPWLAAGATTTEGNNVVAYADLAEPDGLAAGDLLADVTAPGVFDRSYDPAQPPDVSDAQRKAAVTQLFYDVNFFHDWFYDKGFDEAAGNAQASNYGRGGYAEDALEAQGQDFSGTDNADMSTPSDGMSPRMQMYVFRGASAARARITDAPAVDFVAAGASFGPASYDLTAPARLADDGLGTVTDACEALPSMAGLVAVVDRGTCPFVDKAANAEAAGAVAVVVVNNQPAGLPPLGGDGAVGIPVLGLTLADGNTLKQRLAAGTVHLQVSRTASVDHDGTIDNAVVAHEWGHYISNRLIGDANGISNNQGVGLGEGWGDFHSLLMAIREGDGAAASGPPWSGVFPVATYVAAAGMGEAGYYFGLRRVPYSTDLSRNGLTFKHIQDGVPLPSNVPTAYGLDGGYNSEVHATGEVWATMLWECYAALLRDVPRLSFAQAQDRMRGYLVASYKATPLMPTFVDARDALLSVAAAKDASDFQLFAAAFAKRGLGLRAVAPDRDSWDNSGVVESFSTGNDVVLVSARIDDARVTCDKDGNLDDHERGYLILTVQNVGMGELSSLYARATADFPGLTFPRGNSVDFPTLKPFARSSAAIEVALEGATEPTGVVFQVLVRDPSLAEPAPDAVERSFRVNFDVQPSGSATDDVEAAQTRWEAGADPNGNTSSNFRVFQGDATSHWWFGPDPASPADTWLESPALAVDTKGSFSFTFRHRYAFEADDTEAYDGGVVEISTDGGRIWRDLGSKLAVGYTGTLGTRSHNPIGGRAAYVRRSAGYPDFITETVNLGTTYAGKTVRVRFRIGSDDAAADKGWEIDDISFAGLSSLPFASIVADPNVCPNHTPVAQAGPDQVVAAGDTVALQGTATDEDGDTLTLSWMQVGGPRVDLKDATFVAPTLIQETVLTFALTAFDGMAYSEPSNVAITVRAEDRPPVVQVPALVHVKPGEQVRVQATAVDPEGAPVTWTWKQTGGARLLFAGAATDTIEFKAPTLASTIAFSFTVRVSDGVKESAPRSVTVQVDAEPVGGSVVPEAPSYGLGCASVAGAPALWALGALAALLRRRRPG